MKNKVLPFVLVLVVLGLTLLFITGCAGPMSGSGGSYRGPQPPVSDGHSVGTGEDSFTKFISDPTNKYYEYNGVYAQAYPPSPYSIMIVNENPFWIQVSGELGNTLLGIPPFDHRTWQVRKLEGKPTTAILTARKWLIGNEGVGIPPIVLQHEFVEPETYIWHVDANKPSN